MKKILTIILLLSIVILYAVSAQKPEPGTGFSTAPQLGEGTYSYHLEEMETHFFKVWLEGGQSLYAILRVPMEQDFDLFLLSPERDLLDRSVRPEGQTERVSYQAPYPGYYYIVVSSYGRSSGLYTLSLRIISRPTKTLTVTVTERYQSIKTVMSPTVVVETVTETIYLTETSIKTIYVERFPWIFAGLLVIGLFIGFGLLEIARSLKTRG